MIRSGDELLVQQNLQLVQQVVLDLRPQNAVGIVFVLLDLLPLEPALPQKLRGVGLHGVGLQPRLPGELRDQRRLRRDQLLDLQPVWQDRPVLDAADLFQQDRDRHRVPLGGKAGAVFQLLVPEQADLLVHGLQGHGLGLLVLLGPVEAGVLIEDAVHLPLGLVGRRADPHLGGLHGKVGHGQGMFFVQVQQRRVLQHAGGVEIRQQNQHIHRQLRQQAQEERLVVPGASAKENKDADLRGLPVLEQVFLVSLHPGHQIDGLV